MYTYADKKQTVTNQKRVDTPKTPIASTNVTGIPDSMKARFENLSGFSFDDVRVNYNSDKPAKLRALAYTQGNQVHISQGQEKYLGHELGHVVQQKARKVMPETYVNGLPVNDNPALEAQASMYAREAMLHTNSAAKPAVPSATSISVVQKASNYEGILPRHDLLGGTFSYKGEQRTDFTYHHIIPENFLNIVSARITAFDTGSISGSAEFKAFKTKALGLRKDTRTKDTFLALNKRFPGKITLDEARINSLLAGSETFDIAKTAICQVVLNDLQNDAKKVLLAFDASKEVFNAPLSLETIKEKYVANVKDRSEMLDSIITLDWFTAQFTPQDGVGPQLLPRVSTDNIFLLMKNMISAQISPNTAALNYLVNNAAYGIKPIITRYLAPPDDEPNLEGMMAWIPGNIHRGPSTTIRSKSDDGGNGFENSAQNVVTKAHFEKLKALHRNLLVFQRDFTLFESLDQIVSAGKLYQNAADYKTAKTEHAKLRIKLTKDVKVVFLLMTELFDCGFTEFNPTKWKEIEEPLGDTKMSTIP